VEAKTTSIIPTHTIEESEWKQFAYVQYATNLPYLCNSVMTFESLHRLGAKADKLLLYDQNWKVDGSSDRPESRLLISLRDDYGVVLKPIEVITQKSDPTWSESFTKFLAFNQTEYKRVAAIDSDTNILQNIDELFLFPSTFLAMPKMYWEPKKEFYTSLLLLIEPKAAEYQRLVDMMKEGGNGFDMDIINKLYKGQIATLPHETYAVLTGEWRATDHKFFSGNETWDPVLAYEKTKILHFSDWPVAKPWLNSSLEVSAPNMEPERTIWFKFYGEFKSRRKRLCFGLAR